MPCIMYGCIDLPVISVLSRLNNRLVTGYLAFGGNICDFEGKFIIYMDISVFFLQTILKICKKLTSLDANFDFYFWEMLHFFPPCSQSDINYLLGLGQPYAVYHVWVC